jgi:hypothetical protein
MELSRSKPSGREYTAFGLAIAHWLEEQFQASERRVCKLVSIAVSSFRYCSRRSDEDLRERLVRLAREKPCYGYRGLQVLIERWRAREPQASLPGISRGGATPEAEEARTLRPQRTTTCSTDSGQPGDLGGSGIGGAAPRRRRSASERRRVVEEILEAGASVARVAST